MPRVHKIFAYRNCFEAFREYALRNGLLKKVLLDTFSLQCVVSLECSCSVAIDRERSWKKNLWRMKMVNTKPGQIKTAWSLLASTAHGLLSFGRSWARWSKSLWVIDPQANQTYLLKKKKTDVKSLGNHEFHLEHGDLGIKCLVLKDNWLCYYTFFD